MLGATDDDPFVTASVATDVEDVTPKDAAFVVQRNFEEVPLDEVEVDWETDEDDEEVDPVVPGVTVDGGEVLLTSRVYKDSSAASC